MADKLYALSNIVHGKHTPNPDVEPEVEEIKFGDEVPTDLDAETLEELKESGAVGTKDQLDAMVETPSSLEAGASPTEEPAPTAEPEPEVQTTVARASKKS